MKIEIKPLSGPLQVTTMLDTLMTRKFIISEDMRLELEDGEVVIGIEPAEDDNQLPLYLTFKDSQPS